MRKINQIFTFPTRKASLTAILEGSTLGIQKLQMIGTLTCHKLVTMMDTNYLQMRSKYKNK